MCQKHYIWNPAAWIAKILDIYQVLFAIQQISVIILPAFLLLTEALLVAVSICYCLIKYKAKQKHLLSYTSRKKK